LYDSTLGNKFVIIVLIFKSGANFWVSDLKEKTLGSFHRKTAEKWQNGTMGSLQHQFFCDSIHDSNKKSLLGQTCKMSGLIN
jgi:hypothetical protein